MSVLFEEMEIGSLRAKNRLVRAATYEALADDGGHMTPELTAIYEELADGDHRGVCTRYAKRTAESSDAGHLRRLVRSRIPGIDGHGSRAWDGYRIADRIRRLGDEAPAAQQAHPRAVGRRQPEDRHRAGGGHGCRSA